MKKTFLGFLCLLTLSSYSFGQTTRMYCDYETVTCNYQAFGCNYQISNNPDIEGINTSANVGHVITGSQDWVGLYTDLTDGFIDFTLTTTFSLKVWSDTDGTVLLKLENACGSKPSIELSADYTDTGNWQELSYDFTGTPDDSYNRIVLLFNYGETDEGENWYFDDISGPGITIPQTTRLCANIIGNTTWSDTVKVFGNLTVIDNSTLTINPGTYVEFQGHYSLNVQGGLLAVGNENDTVVFTINDTTNFTNMEVDSGGWNGIRFDDVTMNNDTSKIICCRIEYGKAVGIDDHEEGGAIEVVNSSKILISQCNIYSNIAKGDGGGISIFNSGVTITHNLIHHNKVGVAVENSNNVIIRNNIIANNYTSEKGGGITTIWSRTIIDKNIICNNSSDGGGGLFSHTSTNTITGNLIVNNTANWIGACYFYGSSPVFYNNTVCNNSCSYGPAIQFSQFSDASLINDILWGNVNGEPGNEEYLQIAFGESSSNPNFYNCIIQGGTKSFQSTPEVTYSGDTINIFDINPAFIKPAAGAGANFSGLSANWCVQDTSSCINNGTNDALKHLPSVTDIAGNPRIIHGYIDIGAYEKRIVKIEASGSIEEYTRWIADTLEIKGDIKVRDSITLDIAPGTYIEFQGYHKMAVEGTILAIGTVKDPITFTINDTAGFTNRSITKGGWYGISFDNSDGGANGKMSDNDTSKLIHCTIEYAKDYDSLFLQGGAIKTNYFSKLIIKNCTIRYNNAYSGGGIGLMSGSSPLIDGNIIYRNTARRRGGGISCEQKSEARIINNIISNNSLIDNTGWPKGGGGLACNSADPFILNNIICNNESLFAWGGGINLFDSYPTFANNTVCNNLDRGGWSGGGIFAQCDPVIFNTILWGNVSGTDTLQVTSDNHPDFYNCNIQGGRSGIGPFWYDYQGLTIEIQDGNPRFKSPTQGAGIEYDGLAADWSITEFSPNINAGMPDVSGLNLPEIRELIGESLI